MGQLAESFMKITNMYSRPLRRCPDQSLNSWIPPRSLSLHQIANLIRVNKVLPGFTAVAEEFVFVRETPDDHISADHHGQVQSRTEPELPFWSLAFFHWPALADQGLVFDVLG